MSNNNTANATASTSFPVLGLAFVVLFVLKVAGEAGASWGIASLSWWIVFSPVLLGLGLSMVFLLIFVAVAYFATK